MTKFYKVLIDGNFIDNISFKGQVLKYLCISPHTGGIVLQQPPMDNSGRPRNAKNSEYMTVTYDKESVEFAYEN